MNEYINNICTQILGEFGDVYKGILRKPSDKEKIVAVKTLKVRFISILFAVYFLFGRKLNTVFLEVANLGLLALIGHPRIQEFLR